MTLNEGHFYKFLQHAKINFSQKMLPLIEISQA